MLQRSQPATLFRDFLSPPRVILVICIILVLAGAIAIRGYYYSDSLLVSDSQYRSALLARAFYFKNDETIPERNHIALGHNTQSLSFYKVPIMELSVSALYQLLGQENLVIPRLLSATFWFVGGVFLFKLATYMFSSVVAALILAYYLYLPLGVIVSVSILPDSLMIALFLASLTAIMSYRDQPSLSRLLLAATVSGIAMSVKPFAFFSIPAVFISLFRFENTSDQRISGVHTLIFLGIAVLPSVFYLSHGILQDKFTGYNNDVNFLPHLVFRGEYWKGWLLSAWDAVGFTPFIAALLGLAIFPAGATRASVIGLWIGYVLFCLCFTFRIPYGSLHHLPLLVIVALSSGPILLRIESNLIKHSAGWYRSILLATAFLLIGLSTLLDTQSRFAKQKPFESPEIAREIGQTVGHSNRSVYIASYYGKPLQYYGRLSGSYWPRPSRYWALRKPNEQPRSVEERIKDLGFEPEYFIVTDFNEFNRHHSDLKRFLYQNCSVIADHDRYLIYGTCARSYDLASRQR